MALSSACATDTEPCAVACCCSREDMVAERVTAILHFLQDLSVFFFFFFFFFMCLVLQWTSPFPSPILLLTPPPAMEMNSVLWIWGWRWGLKQISSPACKTASWLAANILQVLSSQPEFLSAITWPWIPRQRNVHAFFFLSDLCYPESGGEKKLEPHTGFGLWGLPLVCMGMCTALFVW